MNLPDFNWLDILLVAILTVSVVTSLAKGLTRELIGLASAVAGLIGGIWLHGWAGSFVAPYVSSKSVAHLCGFLIVLFGALAAGALVNFVIGKVIRVAGVSWLDRLLGAGFGFVRAVLVAVALVMALVAFAPGASAGGPPGAVVNSRLAPYVIDAARVLVAMAPRELNDEFQNRYAQVRRLWQDALDKNLSRQVL
jgi:membrane protein required for colicin V production